jgi:hypothetical protein
VLIYRRAWRMRSPSLNERMVLGARDFLVASIAARLALSRLGYWAIEGESALLLLATALLLVSLPSIYWLWLYFRGRFRGSPA